MINARKILRNIRNLSRQEKIALHSGRKMWLLDCVVDDDYGHIPRTIMQLCAKMYIDQGCCNGYKHFALWLHDVYEHGSRSEQAILGKTIDGMNAHQRNEVDSYAVERLLRRKPRDVSIDVETLIQDLDSIYDTEGQRELEAQDTTIEHWIDIIACGLTHKSEIKPADGEFIGYENRTITYAASQALDRVGAVHYIEGEKVKDGIIKVAVDKRYNISENYEKITLPYADVKKWNNENPMELWCAFTSYDEKTGLCNALKPAQCTLKTDEKYNTAYAYKRQQKQKGNKDILPPVISVDDLNVEVPECLLN